MQKKVFFLMRYSVLSRDKRGWRIGRENSYLDYKRALFSHDRLECHFNLLSRYVIPSVEAQDSGLDDVSLLIFTSDQLPDEARHDLINLVGDKRWVHVTYVSEDDNLNEEMRNSIKSQLGQVSACYATVRLDDDDFISRFYLKALWKYVREDFNGFVISFPEGFVSKVDNKSYKIEETLSVRVPKTALGLAHIAVHDPLAQRCVGQYSHIYELGDHTRVNQRAPYLADYSLAAYVRTCYEHQDTVGYNYRKAAQQNSRVSSNVLKRSFHLSDEDFLQSHDDC